MSSVPVAGGDIQDYLGQAGPLFETISDKLEVLVDCETPDSEKKNVGTWKKYYIPSERKETHTFSEHAFLTLTL